MFFDRFPHNTEKEVIKFFLAILKTKQNGASSYNYAGVRTELLNLCLIMGVKSLFMFVIQHVFCPEQVCGPILSTSVY